MTTSRSLGHRAPLLWLVLPMMIGLAVGRTWDVAETRWLLTGALALATVALFATKRRWTWAITLGLAMVFAGAASYALHRARLPEWETRPAREVQIALRVERVFPQTDPKKTAGLATVARSEEHLRELAGQRIYFSLALKKGEVAPVRSAEIAAVGVLTVLPKNPPADSFDGYLADAGMNFKLGRGRVLAEERAASAYQRFCARLAERMNAWLTVGLERRPELAAVYRAMMLGQKHELGAEQKELFMHSGTMHLFAINGLHIGVVAVALHTLLALARCPRWPASALVLAVLWLDVDTTGASPSAVRAFIMVAVVEVAWAARRPMNPLAAIAAAGLLVLVLRPMDFFSASFRMSYGVVTAIVLVGLPLADWMEARWQPWKSLPAATWTWWQQASAWLARHATGAVAIGVAATLVSTVTGVEFFHVLAPAGFFANLVLVPLAMLVIVAGFASLVVSAAGLAVAGNLFNHAAGLLIAWIDGLIRVGTRVPGAYGAARFRAELIGPVALAVLLAVLFAGYASGWRRERGGWWPPVALVAAVMIFGVKFG